MKRVEASSKAFFLNILITSKTRAKKAFFNFYRNY